MVKEAQNSKQRKPLPVKTRNKRMFGALIGHLANAKKILDADKQLFRKQNTVEKVAREKELTRKEQLRAQDAEQIQKKTSVVENRRELRAKMREIESTIRRTKELVQNSERRSSYLATTSAPSIMFLPKTHNEKSRSLLLERKKALEKERAMYQSKIDEASQTRAKLEDELQRISDTSAGPGSRFAVGRTARERADSRNDFDRRKRIKADHHHHHHQNPNQPNRGHGHGHGQPTERKDEDETWVKGEKLSPSRDGGGEGDKSGEPANGMALEGAVGDGGGDGDEGVEEDAGDGDGNGNGDGQEKQSDDLDTTD